MTAAVERYLAAFHDARPGITAAAFGGLPVCCGDEVFASSYDALLAVLPAARDRARQALDLACGDGHLLERLAARLHPSSTLIGIDLSRGELEAAAARPGLGATLLQGRAQCLPLADASVDIACCHMALMLMEDAERVVAELARVMRKGAVLAAVVGSAAPASNAAVQAFRASFPGAERRADIGTIRFGDRRFRSEAGIRALLEPAFDAVQVDAVFISRRCTPIQVWDWLLDMYDTDLLTTAGREDLRLRYLQTLEGLCGPAGDLLFEENLMRIRATAHP
jgi:SAM-dependent methyltransferase